MPALLPAPGIIRFAIHSVLGDAPMINVFHAKYTANRDFGPVTTAELTTLCQEFGNQWASTMMQWETSAVQLVQVSGTDLTSELSPSVAVNRNDPGGATPFPMPANAALCISWAESIKYRGGHARTYFGGWHRDQVEDPRHVKIAFAASVAASANAFRNQVNLITNVGLVTRIEMGCLHRRKANANRNPPLFLPIGAATVNTRIDSQRRRLGK